MRLLWLMPVTYLAGQHGFDLFAPYLIAFLAVTHGVKVWKRAAAVHAAVPIRVFADAHSPASPIELKVIHAGL